MASYIDGDGMSVLPHHAGSALNMTQQEGPQQMQVPPSWTFQPLELSVKHILYRLPGPKYLGMATENGL